MRFIKGFRTKQMDIIFNPYRSLPSILFPQREQLEIFTLFLVITGFLFTGEEGGGGEGGAFSWIKARFPRDG